MSTVVWSTLVAVGINFTFSHPVTMLWKSSRAVSFEGPTGPK